MADGEKAATEVQRRVVSETGSVYVCHVTPGDEKAMVDAATNAFPDSGPWRVQSRTVTTTEWEDVSDA